jgi:Ca-activated chloride channel family protein
MKRVILLLLLFVCAVTWACVMSIDFWRRQSTPASGGVTAQVAYVDKAAFPDVTVYLSVLDGSGEPASGLTEADFSVSEDGVLQPVTDFIGSGDQPVTAVMLIDHSGSMSDGSKMTDAIAAAVAFLDQLENGRDSLGVIAFDDTFTVLGDLRVMDDGVRADLRSQIGVLYPGSNTAYYDAIYKAAGMLEGVPGRKVVLALTDGMDNRSSHSLNRMIEYAQDGDIVVYTIGLGADVEASRLRQIARETGGQYYEEPGSGDLAQLYTDIAQGLQSEYSLTYRSPTPQLDGTTRQVEVAVDTAAGTAVAAGSYAVGGTLAPSLNLWACLGGPLALVVLVALLAAPGLTDRVRGRGRLAEAGPEPEPPQPVAPVPSPVPAVPPAAPPVAPAPVTTCPACGVPLRPGAQFCRACGAPQAVGKPTAVPPQATTCVHCGAPLRPGARFCAKCGQGV